MLNYRIIPKKDKFIIEVQSFKRKFFSLKSQWVRCDILGQVPDKNARLSKEFRSIKNAEDKIKQYQEESLKKSIEALQNALDKFKQM